ncbi:hypothetical protein JOF56_009956 [Kibdelosporangium banguiense]|uniref:Uncharacterized protein n=1 Tax=Kibdelosporangium banguiense TaxID=1365924 RepID=A0ABS4TYW6_9PSEU|nr:hypothetical protein [Kibdelosporangium banguiense]
MVGLRQAGDPLGGGGERDPVSGLAGSDAQVCLPVTGGPGNTAFSLLATKSR